ncbi:MAG: M23 family metallopeptidase [Anaerolineae bacterium]
MMGRRARRLVVLVLALLGVWLCLGGPDDGVALPGTACAQTAPEDDLQSAFALALRAYLDMWAGDLRYQPGPIHQEGDWAYQIAEQVDEQGRTVGVRFVALLGHRKNGKWLVLSPRNCQPRDYNALLGAFPLSLLSEYDRAFLRLQEGGTKANMTGHRLPWPAGQLAYMTQKDVYPYHMNQVDFDIRGLVAAGDVYASKPGTVVFVKESSQAGGCSYGYSGKQNVVVVQHGPQEYTWYVHLAYNSVPVEVGQTVGFGTKIGVEGDTGYACGVHLHYMASTSVPATWPDPADPNVSPWPPSGITAVDFVEVPWSGLVEMQTYVSQNQPLPEAARIEVVSPLVLTPGGPLWASPITGAFRLRNTGGQAITLSQVTVAARGPDCGDWSCAGVVDWPALNNRTLQPGQELDYWGQKGLPLTGEYFAEPAYKDTNGVWHTGLEGGNRVVFRVGADGTPTPYIKVFLPLVLADARYDEGETTPNP